jgi:hypothetical protein
LYGVIGSLIGSNLGGELYGRILTPIVGHPGASTSARGFWTGFALTGFITAGSLFVYDRLFGKDTAVTRRRARQVMIGLYGGLVLGAPAMLVFLARHAEADLPAKTLIQCSIMLALGVFGLWTLLRKAREKGLS